MFRHPIKLPKNLTPLRWYNVRCIGRTCDDTRDGSTVSNTSSGEANNNVIADPEISEDSSNNVILEDTETAELNNDGDRMESPLTSVSDAVTAADKEKLEEGKLLSREITNVQEQVVDSNVTSANHSVSRTSQEENKLAIDSDSDSESPDIPSTCFMGDNSETGVERNICICDSISDDSKATSNIIENSASLMNVTAVTDDSLDATDS